MSVVTIYTPSDARATILRRVPWEDQEMPAAVLDGIERIFGARIAPAEAVARDPAGCPGTGRCGAARVGAADRPAATGSARSAG